MLLPLAGNGPPPQLNTEVFLVSAEWLYLHVIQVKCRAVKPRPRNLSDDEASERVSIIQFSSFLISPSMLPRQFRRTVPAHSLRLTTSPYHPHAPLAALRYRKVAGSVASFHSTSRRREELPKSPFQTFVDVLREELRKNRELQENVKQLQGDVDKIQDSETMRRARAAYERARVRVVLRFSSSSSQSLQGLLTKAGHHCIAHLEHPRKPPATGCRGGTQKTRGQSRRCGLRSTQDDGRERTRSRGTRSPVSLDF